MAFPADGNKPQSSDYQPPSPARPGPAPGHATPGHAVPGPPIADIADDPAADEGYEDFEQMFELENRAHASGGGQWITGQVVSVNERGLLVDIGTKLEGFVPIEQVQQADGTVPFAPGDTIQVAHDRNNTSADGYVLLSFERANRHRVWDTLEAAFAANQVVTGRVTGRVKGGLEVDVGVKAFMPSSQLDMRPIHNLDSYTGQEIQVKILKLNRRRGNLVVSRKAVLEEDFNQRKDAVLGHVEEGSIVTGTVKNLTDYGAFVDLGGIDGLLHVSDMSHGRVNHPQEIVQPGDSITCRVLKLDKEKGRVSLGLKQLVPDPWETVAERFAPGTRVIGRVVSVTDYGAFVELESGVEGLIHISEMTWSRRMKHPSKVVKPGDQVEAVVLEIKGGDRRISLGIKQLEADPWTTIQDRYSIGSVVEGRIRKLSDFGAFVEVEEGVDGLIHISDFSWTERLKHPSEVIKKGQMVQAVILNIDTDNRRLSLGVKQLQPDAWETFFQTHFVNDVVHGKVVRASSFGVFVEISPGVEGLCHNSEIPGAGAPAERRGEKRGSAETGPPLPIGAEFDFKIIKMNETDKKIGLSLKEMATLEDLDRIKTYQARAQQASSVVESAIERPRDPAEPE
jgi:small subunit ribosomal protein S1